MIVLEPLNQLKQKNTINSCILYAGFHALVLNWVINPIDKEHEIKVLRDIVWDYQLNTWTTILTSISNYYHSSFKKLTNIWDIGKAFVSWKAIVMIIEQKNLTSWLKDSLDGQIDDITISQSSAWTWHAICVIREGITAMVYDSLGGRKYKMPNLFKHIVSKQLRNFVYLLDK